MRQPEPRKAKTKDPGSRYKSHEFHQLEEQKKALMEENKDSQELIPGGLSSQHVHRMMGSKLKILKNTIDIIDESIISSTP